jgi:Uma2 family endonuclease
MIVRRVVHIDADPIPRPFSRDEYWAMAKLGFFDDQRVELIGGEVVVVAAQGNAHGAGVTLVRRALEAAFGDGYWVQTQQTLDLAPHSQPDPDVAVVVGDPAHPAEEIATTALLIVEVSGTTLRTDRGRKASLYAAAGIPDYWIVNLQDLQLEVRRDPQPDSAQEFGHGYGSLRTYQLTDSVSPLALPAVIIPVDRLIPQ